MKNNYFSIFADQGRFWRLAGVNILSNLMVPLASLVDIAFLGHLTEIRHLAGVAIATVLFNYLYWTFGFLRMGTTGLTAQAQGRGEREQVFLIL
jgi:MATE family multidrug resistance protein